MKRNSSSGLPRSARFADQTTNCYNGKTKMKYLLLLLICTIPAFAQNKLVPHWVVIVNTESDSATAAMKHRRYVDNDYHSFVPFSYVMNGNLWEYPRLMKTDTVEGLKNGLWVTVNLITKHKSVADEMITYLNVQEKECYKKQIMLPDYHDVRAIQCSDIKVVVAWTHPETNVVHYSEPEEVSYLDISTDTDQNHSYISWTDGYGLLSCYLYKESLEGTTVAFSGGGFFIQHLIPFENHIIWRVPPFVCEGATPH